MTPAIDVTVAAVIERRERFLVVEEHASGDIVFNQPAGHLEPGESLIDAVVRETREETGYAFEPRSVLGVYLWQCAETAVSFLRVAFCGDAGPLRPNASLDDGIIAAHWLTRSELLGRRARLRTPMVLRCIDDYRAGTRYPLECLTDLQASSIAPTARSVP
jgi:ADP-ribose pyrophosphatase YjhB (NUDIX family)